MKKQKKMKRMPYISEHVVPVPVIAEEAEEDETDAVHLKTRDSECR